LVLVSLITAGIEKGFVSREKTGVCYGKTDACVCEV
jgi:hypothetical protein